MNIIKEIKKGLVDLVNDKLKVTIIPSQVKRVLNFSKSTKKYNPIQSIKGLLQKLKVEKRSNEVVKDLINSKPFMDRNLSALDAAKEVNYQKMLDLNRREHKYRDVNRLINLGKEIGLGAKMLKDRQYISRIISRGNVRQIMDIIKEEVEEEVLRRGHAVRLVGKQYVIGYEKFAKSVNYNIESEFSLSKLDWNPITSDPADFIFEGQFIVATRKPKTVFVMHNRSKIGQGNDLLEVKEIVNNNIFVPTSGECFLKCIEFLYLGFKKEVYNSFCIKDKVIKDKFPQCKIQRFNEYAGTNVGIFDPIYRKVTNFNKKKYKYYDHVLAIIEGHYVVLRGSPLTECYKEAAVNIMWTKKEVDDESITNLYTIKPKELVSITGFENLETFVWDVETFKNEYSDSIPYACSFMSIGDIDRIYNMEGQEDNIREGESWISEEKINVMKKKVKVYEGEECILNMIDYFVQSYKKGLSRMNKNKAINIYAHNASKFDNHILISLKELYFHSILKTGRGLVRLVTRHELGLGRVKNNKGEWVSQKMFLEINWCCSMSFLSGSLDSNCYSYKLPNFAKKSTLDHDKITSTNYMDYRNEWHPYLILDIISLGLIFYTFIKANVETLKIHPNSCISNSSMAWSSFLSTRAKLEICCVDKQMNPILIKIRDDKKENQKYKTIVRDLEPISCFNNPTVAKLIRDSIYGGRVCAMNNKFEVEGFDEIKEYIFKYMEVKTMSSFCNKMDNIRAEICIEWKDAGHYLTKAYAEFSDYYEMRFVNLYPELSSYLKEAIKGKDLLVASDATSLYPSAMEKYKQWPKAEGAINVFKYQKKIEVNPDEESFETPINNVNDLIYAINNGEQTDMGILEVDIEIPEDNFFIVCALKENNGSVYATGRHRQVMTTIDIEESVKYNRATIYKIHQGIMFTQYFHHPLFRDFVRNLFKMRAQFKTEGNKSAADICKLMLNSIYGKTVQKEIKNEMKFETEEMIKRNYDNTYEEYIQLNNGDYLSTVTTKSVNNKVPTHLGSMLLSYSKRLMNDFIDKIGGFKERVVWYMDTDSLYILQSDYEKLNKLGLVGKRMGQTKNDYGNGGIIYGMFIANKIKFCITVSENGVIDTHKTFKGCEMGKAKTTSDVETGEYEQIEMIGYQDFQDMLDGKSVEKTISRWERTMNGVKVNKDNMTKVFTGNINERRRNKPTEFIGPIKKGGRTENGWMSPLNINQWYKFGPEEGEAF